MDQFGQGVAPGAVPGIDEDADAELARAIEASYAAQTGAGMNASEDELLAEAMRQSALEEEARKRREQGLPEDEEVSLVGGTGAGAASRVADTLHTGGAARAQADAHSSGGRLPAGEELGGDVASMEEDFAAIAARGAFDDAMQAASRQGVPHPGVPRHGAGGGMLVPDERMDAAAMEAAAVAEQADESDRQLAMAIEASYVAQTEHGRVTNEDDLMEQALRMSKQEDEARQRADLRESQEQELQESVLMDQMREEEQKRRRTEEQQLERLEAERLVEEATKRQTDDREKKEQEEQKRARIPTEPAAGEPGRVDFMIRLPDGKRMRRAFRGENTVGQVYDYVDVEAAEAVAAMANYRLVATMPRQTYEDRSLTLVDAGLKGQCALNVESVQA